MLKKLETRKFSLKQLPLEETLFHCANGYLGVRGNFEEGYPSGTRGIRGCYMNGFYDTHGITHPEKLYGFPDTGEKILNITDSQEILIEVDGEILLLTEERVSEFYRLLDMDAGLVRRSFLWTGARGKRVRIEFKRMASFIYPELFSISCTIAALDPVTLKIRSTLKGGVRNYFDPSDPRVSGHEFRSLQVTMKEAYENTLFMESRTAESGLCLMTLSTHQLTHPGKKQITAHTYQNEDTLGFHWETELEMGQTLNLEKRNYYGDTRRFTGGAEEFKGVISLLERYPLVEIEEAQKEYLEHFWKDTGLSLQGDDEVLKGLIFNMYHLLQSVPRDSFTGIPAKGLSGEGYEGHYFWDTEIYMLPVLLHTRPELARNLLAYRHRILPAARKHARELGHARGAAFPWRTIAGRECSAYFPSGSAQYHINGDIAYAVWQYWLATEDEEFMQDAGAELLFETARIWLEVGNFHEGDFYIHGVTGPDEYTCLINNNYYTNQMARYNLEKASWVFHWMKKHYPESLERVSALIHLDEEEVSCWQEAASSMFIPYDSDKDIHPQDDSFLKKPLWNFETTEKENYPLLLHYHPMTLSRFQVCKQADTVLSYVLLNPEVKLSTLENSTAYYEKITTHDSSLSYGAFSIMASRLGDPEKAYRYFRETVNLDLENLHGNSKDGIHAANMGGTWMAVVWGFGGYYPGENMPCFSPRLPKGWEKLAYRIRYRGRVLKVEIAGEHCDVHLLSGEPLKVNIQGKEVLLSS